MHGANLPLNMSLIYHRKRTLSADLIGARWYWVLLLATGAQILGGFGTALGAYVTNGVCEEPYRNQRIIGVTSSVFRDSSVHAYGGAISAFDAIFDEQHGNY